MCGICIYGILHTYTYVHLRICVCNIHISVYMCVVTNKTLLRVIFLYDGVNNKGFNTVIVLW